MSPPDAAIGAIAAATITSLFAFVGLIISKESKTSEFRQAWIDGLRQEISELLGYVEAIVGTVRVVGRGTGAWESAHDDIVQLNRCAASIRLRLNPSETASKDIIVVLDDLERFFVKDDILPESAIKEAEKRMLIEAQKLLKSEWKRVKSGESTFRWSKRLVGILFVLTTLALFSLVFRM